MIGTTRETVSRLFSEFKKKQLLAIERLYSHHPQQIRAKENWAVAFLILSSRLLLSRSLKFLAASQLDIVIWCLLLYFNTKSTVKTLIILLAVPFSAIGAIWFLYLLNYNMSIAVWVGLIALLGVDAETAVFMLLYVDLAYHDAISKGRMNSWDDLREAIVVGAVKRLRPKVMTVACMLFGLLPIMWSVGAGGDVMKRIAAPMIGGIITSFLMELIIYPPVFAIWKWNFEVRPKLKQPAPNQLEPMNIEEPVHA